MGFINSDLLNDDVADFITKLVREYPKIEEIWLFGGRANGRERPDSDWDLLIFAYDDGATFDIVRKNETLKIIAGKKLDKFDVFILCADNDVVNPWRKAKLNLIDINWQVWSPETSAEYDGETNKEAASMVWSVSQHCCIS